MASKSKTVTTDDFAFDDENESSSFSMILNKAKASQTNLGHSSDKPRTKESLAGETSDKPKTEPRTNHRTNLGHSSDKPRTIFGFSELSGLQKEITLLLYEMCFLRGERSTGPVSVEHIFLRLNSTRLSVQKSIQRLEQKKILLRKQSRSGRGGWTVYELPENIWNQILQIESSDKLRTNLGHSSDKPKTEPKTEPRTSAPSSSRDLYIKGSTTTQLINLDVLGALDLAQLREFGITHDVFKRALQLHPNASVDGLQELAFRLGELFKNPKERAKIQNARGFVIKLVEQLASGITPLDHIETPTDRLMREYAALSKQKRAEQQGFDDALLQDAFEKWNLETVDNEKFQAVPIAKNAPAGQPRLAVFREYFREKVWPEERARILRGET